jgi:ABC-type branched-subunit amino acid transport system ATPase component
MIELKNVKMCFEDFNALDVVDLTIEAGTAFGLLGSNGAGKSTILRLLSGVYEAAEGEVLIDGEPAYDNVSAKQKVFFGFGDKTTVWDGISLCLFEMFLHTCFVKTCACYVMNVKVEISIFHNVIVKRFCLKNILLIEGVFAFKMPCFTDAD